MKQKSWSIIFTIIAVCVMSSVVKSSSMTYQSQTLVPVLEEWVTQSTIESLFGWISFSYAGKNIEVETLGYAAFLEFFIRKFAHFGTYLLIAFSWVKAVAPLVNYKRLVYGLILCGCVLFAVTDEWHQSFTASRTPLLEDVVIDGLGACMGVWIAYVLDKQKRKMREAEITSV